MAKPSHDNRHPRDRFVTVFGRNSVLDVLHNDRLDVDKVLIAHGLRGSAIEAIERSAGERGVDVERASEAHITKLARNGKQHQGVLADVVAPHMDALTTWLSQHTGDATVMVLAGLTNPSNVGMIIRSAVAAGVAGIVLPRRDTSDLNPIVIKASSGIAFSATILRCETASDALTQLRAAGFHLVGLDASASHTIYDPVEAPRLALVVGNETHGVDTTTATHVDEWRSIPMPGNVESLNVACAASITLFELAVRRNR